MVNPKHGIMTSVYIYSITNLIRGYGLTLRDGHTLKQKIYELVLSLP